MALSLAMEVWRLKILPCGLEANRLLPLYDISQKASGENVSDREGMHRQMVLFRSRL